MLTLDDVLAPAPSIISRKSDDETVVVLPEQGKFIVLNESGAEVFQMMDGEHTLEEIAAALGEQHGVPLEQTRTDTLALAGKLLERGALRRVDAASGAG